MARSRSVVSPPTNTSFNSLGSSLTAVASSSAIVVGTSANVVDHEVTVTINGPATMTGSAATQVNLFAYESMDGTVWSGVSGAVNELIDGTDKAITMSANSNNGTFIGTVQIPATAAGASVAYKSKPIRMAAALGGLPSKYVIVAQNQVGAALAASGHSIAVSEIFYT